MSPASARINYRRLRTQYTHKASKLVAKTFGLSKKQMQQDDTSWGNYVAKASEAKYLFSLDHVSDAIKARVIANDYAPINDFRPFAYTEWYDLSMPSKPGECSPALWSFTLQMLELSIDTAQTLEMLHQQTWLSSYDGNERILKKLSVLADDDPAAQGLFDRYRFTNVRQSNDHWNPFIWIMEAEPGVSPRWQRLADERMRAIVEAEPEKRLWMYLSLIRCRLGEFGWLSPVEYDRDLFMSQLEFALTLPPFREKDPRIQFFDENFWAFSETLKNDLPDVRRRIAKFALAYRGAHPCFDVYYPRGAQLARQMLNEFSGDSDLCGRIHELQEAATAKREGERQAEAKRAQAQNALQQLS